MRLKSIYVEGFKSYATPTFIGEFDASFNAITGLNGSGKSNILDAICFAMGITTLSSVRVANLQELIYKQGTAGITKASVTLIFDNSDRNQSPTGYENDPEISVTRQIHVSQPCKYMINGRKALATEVSNMFRSVQLNVNNPHFLIMQGRITKVLNMKPEEIRDMLQEALGTLMYETKKQEAQKKMAQKEVKVQAINETLEKQITPRVEKLREDKKDYDRFNAVVQDLQRHRRFLIAYEFHQRQETSVNGRKELIDIADRMDAIKTSKKAAATEEKNLKGALDERKKQRDAEAYKPFKEAEASEKTASQELVRVSAAKDSLSEDVKQEEKSLEQKKQRKIELEKLEVSTKDQLVAAKTDVETRQANLISMRTNYEKSRQGVESAETGSSDRIQEDLMNMQKQEQQHTTQIKVSEMTIKTKSEAKKKLEKELATARKEESNSAATNHVDQLRSKIDSLHATLTSMEAIKGEPIQEIADLTEQVKKIKTPISGSISFKYDANALGKENKCFGRLISLVRVDDSLIMTHARAMEIVAGSKLLHVVTDTKETSKKLLKDGKLNQRVTVVPLASISANVLEKDRIDFAKKQAKKNGRSCWFALDVLNKGAISEELWPAMRYAFGQTIICEDNATARVVSYDGKIRCVTLAGDLFEPTGTLTGGSRKGEDASEPISILEELHKALKLEARIAELKEIEKRMQERKVLERERENLEHELNMAMGKAAESKVFRLTERLRETEAEIAKCEQERVACTAAIKELTTKMAELKDLLKNSQTLKQKLVAEAKSVEKQAKKALKDSEDGVQASLKKVEELKTAVTRYADESGELVAAISKQSSEIDALRVSISQLQKECDAANAEYQARRSHREGLERKLQSWEASYQEMEAKLNSTMEKVREGDMELKKMEASQQKLKMDVKSSEDAIVAMKKEHLWIEKEMQYFGKPHTEYDFEMKDPAQIQVKYRELEEVQNKLSRSINKKALAMMEKAEEEYDSLDRKRRTIESDRMAIERVISGLDRKKNEALVAAYEKVNKDFGSIFSMLLPGARAELRPVEGGTVLDGLEVKVAFGQTWKDSLAELSGGQRSLLALSLVLALLRFKPAPLYILDEIDAALDLSHTQNIGVMLRTHFSESQFIVVSLKEGMFANASCLFRTKFVDGVSTVTRTVNRVLANTTNQLPEAGQKDKKESKKRPAKAHADEVQEEVEN